MRIVIIVMIAAGIISVALIAMFASALPTQEYDLNVDALKDEQSLFTNARVIIKNTGKLPVTNVLVDYGDKMEPPISVLQPGDTTTVSPPEDVQLDQVTVRAEPNIEIVQVYRTPWKLPGMIGS
jgi:hypothetical protein